jgi:hypothetical protein
LHSPRPVFQFGTAHEQGKALCDMACFGKHGAEMITGVREIRPDGDRPPIGRDSFIESVQLGEYIAEIAMRTGIVWSDRKHSPHGCRGFIEFAQSRESVAEPGKTRKMIRRQCQTPAVKDNCLIRRSRLFGLDASRIKAVRVRPGARGIPRRYLIERRWGANSIIHATVLIPFRRSGQMGPVEAARGRGFKIEEGSWI